MTTTLKEKVDSVQFQLNQNQGEKPSVEIFKEHALQIFLILRKDQSKFYKRMDKISIFYQEILNLNDMIDSLVEDNKYIKVRFSSILDWEKELKFEVIPKVSKNDRRLMHSSLSLREKKAKEVREWAKNAQGQCLGIWEKGIDFIEFDLSGSKPLK